MDDSYRVLYLAFVVMAVVLACLKLWWWAGVCMACIGLAFVGKKTFEDW
jgi:hypothetical protein